jgi:hypothetical protein
MIHLKREIQIAAQQQTVFSSSDRNEMELILGWHRHQPIDNWCGVKVFWVNH